VLKCGLEPGPGNLKRLSGICLWFALAGIVSNALADSESRFEISAEQWARPRSGERVVAYESLQMLVRHLDQRSAAVVNIRYAGGDEGQLWAEELRGWLVALGIPSDRIKLRAGLQYRDRLVLETE